ncbi:MAG: hypothetical protein HY517_01055 [Candidatus Aenigmarchaeota archaeon]|nr:hypothetical protein [Candidatus Aenigmarchaeota archaeon]
MKLPPPFDFLSLPLLIVIFTIVGVAVFSGFRMDACPTSGFITSRVACVVENYPVAVFVLVVLTSPFIFKEKFDILLKGKLSDKERKEAVISLAKVLALTVVFLTILVIMLKFL